jgi:hypothetical protein
MTKKKPEMKLALEPEEDNEKYWSITIGFYPGILFGFRTYEEKDFSTHVLYLPFIDIALEIDN